MGAYFGKFNDYNLSKYFSRITDFQHEMFSYLERQQNRCSWKNDGMAKRIFIDFILKSLHDIITPKYVNLGTNVDNAIEGNSYHIITFNYTNLLDMIVSGCPNIIRNRHLQENQSKYSVYDVFQSVHHVHGQLASQIIMGVNDESQLIMTQGPKLTEKIKRKLIKPVMNSNLYHNLDIPAMETISRSDIIAIYGMSYGKTDNLWWDTIRQWLEMNQEHKLVSFERDFENNTTFKLVWEKTEYDEQKRIEVLQKLGYKVDNPKFEELLDQICIVLNTKRLDLKPILLGDSSIQTIKEEAAINMHNTDEALV